MSKSVFEAQLAAGGMVSTKAKVDPGGVEQVVARRYTGAALGDRVVVRLGAARLGPAEDLAMEFLGLQAAGESQPIAQQQRRALGFASWALITHPDQAKYALALVKRIKAAGRRVKSKPGHAWDEFTVMAAELNRSVKEFLPPFWEEVARIYKDHGNVTYAGRSLTKALEAERVHALAVDSGRRRDAVLEFALGGCLSGKALTDYAKDLQSQFEPPEALETLRDLTIRRTSGGMPPIASAAKDLARLAVAAGQDPDTEIEAMLQGIITSPAMSRAPLQFWTSVKKQVASIVARNPSFAMWLLVHTDPQPSYTSDSAVWKWLELLDQWNVLEYLGKPSAELPDDVEIPGGRAGWVGRLMCVESSPDKRLLDVIEIAAPAIKAEGQPIPLVAHRGYGGTPVDVDALEACLALGLEVTALPKNGNLDFDGWLRADVDHTRRNSSLEHLLKDPRYREQMLPMIPELVKRKATKPQQRSYSRQVPACRSFSEAAQSHAAVRQLWSEFLDGEICRLESGGLHDVEVTLNRLAGCVDAKTGELFPEFTKRLAKVDLASVLQRTLCGGVLDEYGWPALDQVDDEKKIPQLHRRQTAVSMRFPYLTVLRDDCIEVVSSTGYEKRANWPQKNNYVLNDLLAVGDDTLIIYRDETKGYNLRLMWLSDPNRDIETDSYYLQLANEPVMRYGEGIFYGSRVLMPGDDKVPETDHWFSDGERFWRIPESESFHYWNEFDDSEDDEPAVTGLQEIDVITGKRGRTSVPAWFESDLPAGSRVLWLHSMLMPIPPGLTTTPLGSRDGMIGWRVVRRRDGSHESIGIDGRKCVLNRDPLQENSVRCAVAMIEKPATNSHWIVTNAAEMLDEQTGIGLANLEGNKDRYRFGQPLALSPEFFHLMTIRCLDSSKQLRKTTLKQAKVLLDAGSVEHEARKQKEDKDNPDPQRAAASAAVQAWLTTAPPRLVQGVARISRLAAEEAGSLARIQAKLAGEAKQPSNKAATAASTDHDSVVTRGLSELATHRLGKSSHYSRFGDGLTSARASHVSRIAKFFAGESVESAFNDDANWISILLEPASAAWRRFWLAAHSGADDSVPVRQRLGGDWLRALEFLADGGWFDLPGKLTFYIGKPIEQPPADPLAAGRRAEKVKLVSEGDCRYVVYPVIGYNVNDLHVLCYAAKGQCKPPSIMTVTETTPIAPTWKGEQVRAFVKAVGSVETLPLIDAPRLQAAAERLRVSPIHLAMAFMGNFRTVAYGQEKLTKELRNHYGWKVTEIKSAVAALDANPLPLAMVSIGAELDPEGCVGPRKDEAFERVVNAWVEHVAETVTLPPDVLAQLQHVRSGYTSHCIDTPAFIKVLSGPDQAVLLKPSAVVFELATEAHSHPSIVAQYEHEAQEDSDTFFPPLDRAMWLVNYALPFADPARRKLPALAEAILRWIDDPKTVLPFGLGRTEAGYTPDGVDIDATVAKFAAAGLKPEKTPAGMYTLHSDLVVGAMLPPEIMLYFRTSRLTDDAAWTQLLAAAAMTFGWEGDGTNFVSCAEFVRRMREGAIGELIRHNRSDAFAEGAWDQDPRISVPELVSEAAKHLKVSDDAAVLYLQTLALPDPTTKNIQRWNQWTAAQVKRAGDELVSKELLVSAKRSRAGRTTFLPGGWEPLKQPNLPIETWKLPLFGYENIDRLRGGYAELLMCPRIMPGQYHHAWNRVKQGDPPRYEEAVVS